MKEDVPTKLELMYPDCRVVQQLHDVPPHAVYEVIVEGRRAVYKENTGPTGNAGTEGAVIEFVEEHTSIPVPEILLVGDEFFVSAWHPEAPSPDQGQPPDKGWAFAGGKAMAKLHNETDPLIESYGKFRRASDGLNIDGSVEWHSAVVEYVHRKRQVLARYGHADMADAVIDYLNSRPEAFAGAGDPVCCHGWATPEHIAVRNGRVTCMIDFEHALAAPGEFDFQRSIIPTFGIDGAGSARQSFREGYESIRPLPGGFTRRKPLYVLLNVIYFFESLYVQDQHARNEIEEIAESFRDKIRVILSDLA